MDTSTYIIALLESLSTGTQLFIVICVLPLLYIGYRLISRKDFRTDFVNMILRFKRDNFFVLENHEIFLTESIHKQYLTNISFNSEIKDEIFTIILKSISKITIFELREFLKGDIPKIKDIDTTLIRLVDQIIALYEIRILKTMSKKYKVDADYLYKYIYEEQFKKYNANNISYILRTVQMFAKSSISNKQKTYLFFNVVYVALDMAILDCERVFDEINGSLTKYNNKYHK